MNRVKDEKLIWISLFMKLTEYRFHREIPGINFLLRNFPSPFQLSKYDKALYGARKSNPKT
jgi:hypothetical protein